MTTLVKNDQHRARRAFALGGTIMLLFVLLAAICAWRAWIVSSRTVPTSNAAYNTGMKIGIWASPIALPLIVLGVAWVVGKLVSLMFGRSNDAGNIGAGLVLVGALGLMGYSTYTVSQIPATAPTVVAQSGPTQTDAAAAIQRLNEQSRQAMSRMAEQTERQRDAARDAAQRQLDALRSVQSGPPTGTAMPTPPSPQSSAPSPQWGSVPTPVRTPTPDTSALKIENTRTAIISELDAKIQPVTQRLTSLGTELRQRPKVDIRDLRMRADSISTVKASVKDLAAAFKNVEPDAKARLTIDGLSDHDASFAASRIAMDARLSQSGFELDRLIDTLDHALKEAELMRDNIGRWKYAKDGRVDCKDVQLQSSINSARFFLNAGMERWNAEIDAVVLK